MLAILREYIENDIQITEWTKDGVSVSHTAKVPKQNEIPQVEPLLPQETTEQKIDRLEQQVQKDNLIMFEVLATIYEELLAKGSV